MALHHTHPYTIIVKYYIKNMKEKTNQLGTCATCTVTRLENQERVQTMPATTTPPVYVLQHLVAMKELIVK